MHIGLGLASVVPLLTARPPLASLQMVAPPHESAVLWDVDGTLVESTKLAFDATNEVLTAQGKPPVDVEAYKIGCKYTTPERFSARMCYSEISSLDSLG